MKFLICLSGEGPFDPLLRLGGRITKAFGADLSVLFVEDSVRASRRAEVVLAQDKLSQWNIEHPGMQVLGEARDLLFAEEVIVRDTEGAPRTRHALKPDISGAFEMHHYGAADANIRFRLRLGNLFDEIKEEVDVGRYDLLIIRFNENYGFTKDLIHFVNTSLLIVKNVRDAAYDFLVAVDPAKPHRRTELVAAKLAKFFKTRVIVLSVLRHELRARRRISEETRVEKLLRKGKIPYEVKSVQGKVSDEIAVAAGESAIVVLGASRRNTLSQLWRASVAAEVVRVAQCPVLIVR